LPHGLGGNLEVLRGNMLVEPTCMCDGRKVISDLASQDGKA